MKKSVIPAALFAAGLAASPSHALFTNGGFEDGTFNGWSIRWGTAIGGGTTTNPTTAPRVITWHGHQNWEGLNDGNVNDANFPLRAAVVDSNAPTNPYYPAYGKIPDHSKYQALLNYSPYRLQQTGGWAPETWLQGDYDITEIKQRDVVTLGDVSTWKGITGYRVFAFWKAMMENPTDHDSIGRPSFNIVLSVRKAGTPNWQVASAEYHSAWQGATNGWLNVSGTRSGEPIFRKDTTYVVDVALGDSVEIDVQILDCGLGGHGAFAYLDQVGSQPPVTGQNPYDVGDPCLYATQNLSLGDRSVLRGNVGAGQSLWFGTDIRDSGTVFSGGSGSFGDRDRIAGNTYYNGSFHTGNGVVAGPITLAPTLTFGPVPTMAVTPGSTDINFWSGTTTTLPPGSYGNLTGNGTLKLTAGTYQFKSVTIYAGATLLMDNTNGPVNILSNGNMTLDNFKDSIYVMPTAADLQSRAVAWYTNGNLNIYAGNQKILGYFTVPNGNAVIASRPLQGYLHAKNVTVYAGTSLTCTDTY